jgi:hypothetical protein
MHVAHGQKQRTNRLRVLHVAKDAKAAKQPQYHKEREEKVEGALQASLNTGLKPGVSPHHLNPAPQLCQ